MNGGEFFGYLCSTLTALPNLQKIILTNVGRTQGLCWCRQAYLDCHSRTFNPWSTKDQPEPEFLKPLPKHRCFETSNGLDDICWNAWPEILRALFTSGNTKVKAIVTEGGNTDWG